MRLEIATLSESQATLSQAFPLPLGPWRETKSYLNNLETTMDKKDSMIQCKWWIWQGNKLTKRWVLTIMMAQWKTWQAAQSTRHLTRSKCLIILIPTLKLISKDPPCAKENSKSSLILLAPRNIWGRALSISFQRKMQTLCHMRE